VRGQDVRGFFCRFQLHRQSPNHAFQLGDTLLLVTAARFGRKDLGRPFQELGFPAREDRRSQLVLPANLCYGLDAGELFDHEAGFELWLEVSPLCHSVSPFLDSLYINYRTCPVFGGHYNREALESRKEHKPENNAIDMATAMGIVLLTEEQYRGLQKLGNSDLKTSS
jgi:hypothetical protein